MTILALLIALTSLQYFIPSQEVAAGPQFGRRFAEYLTALLFHAGGGMLALVLGPWGFWSTFRNKHRALHRWMGRVYLLSILVGGISGLYIAAKAFGGLPTRISFIMLAALWLSTGALAYLHIRKGNVQVHREWMTRNYALTFSAVTLRLWLPLFLMAGYEFPEAYTTVAWLCWVPNLLVAELIINRGKTQTQRQKAGLSAAGAHAA